MSDSTSIERVRTLVWERIRQYQAGGGKVRSTEMANRFGGDMGFYHDSSPAGTLCLVGVVVQRSVMFPDDHAAEILGISRREANLLESGFEDWSPGGTVETRGMTMDELRAEPYYKLGQEIARHLEDAEAAAAQQA
jgi:hypothetical protein